ncbi:hypothetical protein [Streptomyces wuyuanensis]|uniref:hypothetical protein n=1 Tax=Streptomyces wuyuanensis TaxID=1196353 RepID=UPI0034201CF8
MNNPWWLIPAVLAPGAVPAARSWWRERQPRPPHRTPADVMRDAAIARECRHFAQALDDHDQVWAIWPDAHRAARIAHTQHRLNRRKENGQ